MIILVEVVQAKALWHNDIHYNEGMCGSVMTAMVRPYSSRWQHYSINRLAE